MEALMSNPSGGSPRLVGKLKLIQNREARDILETGETLKQRGNDLIGDAMLKFGAEAKQG